MTFQVVKTQPVQGSTSWQGILRHALVIAHLPRLLAHDRNVDRVLVRHLPVLGNMNRLGAFLRLPNRDADGVRVRHLLVDRRVEGLGAFFRLPDRDADGVRVRDLPVHGRAIGFGPLLRSDFTDQFRVAEGLFHFLGNQPVHSALDGACPVLRAVAGHLLFDPVADRAGSSDRFFTIGGEARAPQVTGQRGAQGHQREGEEQGECEQFSHGRYLKRK